MNTIAVCGIGKLGICFALLAEETGFNVIGIDKNSDYINKVNNKTLNSSEPKVEELLKNSKNFKASENILDIKEAETIFIFVATPSTDKGDYDHSQIINAMLDINKHFKNKNIVIGCTVMPEFCTQLQKMFPEHSISYSPLFIAQGDIVAGIRYPDFILIGQANQEIGNKIEAIYKEMSYGRSIKKMSTLEAELTKLSLNCFITTKIAFTNMVGDIVKKAGGDPTTVLDAIGSDSRVGTKCMKFGFGFGGPCFPRDNRALGYFADSLNLPYEISKASDESNKQHLKVMIEDIEKNYPKDKPIYLDYITYKENSILIDESQQLAFAVSLKNKGYTVIVSDKRQEVLDKIKDIL